MKESYHIYHADCTAGAQQYIHDNSVDLIITDPPYGIDATHLHRHYHRKEKYVIDGYVEIPLEKYAEFSLAWIKQAERVLRPGGSLYIVSGYSNLRDILNALAQTSLQEVNHLIWKYNFGVYTSKKYVSSHYHILYYIKQGGRITFNTYSRFGAAEKDKNNLSTNYRDREDVWDIPREYKPGKRKNKNELPKQLLIKIIQYSSCEGDLIADFFLGGFGTARVAIGLNRRIVGFELNRKAIQHHLKELQKIQPGSLLSELKHGDDITPVNQRKRWHDDERQKLFHRYDQLYKKMKNKRQTIRRLQEEFGRGYFSILNQLEQR